MVKGLDIFRKHFTPHQDSYLLIGGVACYVQMEATGEHFRATKDLDIVLTLETNSSAFIRSFWEFVNLGRYIRKERGDGNKQCYRFSKPEEEQFPWMLELFSANLQLPDDAAHEMDIIPITSSEDISSLSAILLDREYASLLDAGRRIVDGLPVLGTEYLIPFKARAWLDLNNKKASGETIDSKTIKKHLNDIFRLYRIILPDMRIDLPQGIKEDVQLFLDNVPDPLDLKSLGYRKTDLNTVIDGLRELYRI